MWSLIFTEFILQLKKNILFSVFLHKSYVWQKSVLLHKSYIWQKSPSEDIDQNALS